MMYTTHLTPLNGYVRLAKYKHKTSELQGLSTLPGLLPVVALCRDPYGFSVVSSMGVVLASALNWTTAKWMYSPERRNN